MKPLLAALLVILSWPALAQPGYGRHQEQPGRYGQREYQRENPRQMPAPDRRMSWEDRERLREQVRNGNMSRDEARMRWREQRDRRGFDPGRSPEERQRLRRDIQDANRDLERR